MLWILGLLVVLIIIIVLIYTSLNFQITQHKNTLKKLELARKNNNTEKAQKLQEKANKQKQVIEEKQEKQEQQNMKKIQVEQDKVKQKILKELKSRVKNSTQNQQEKQTLEEKESNNTGIKDKPSEIYKPKDNVKEITDLNNNKLITRSRSYEDKQSIFYYHSPIAAYKITDNTYVVHWIKIQKNTEKELFHFARRYTYIGGEYSELRITNPNKKNAQDITKSFPVPILYSLFKEKLQDMGINVIECLRGSVINSITVEFLLKIGNASENKIKKYHAVYKVLKNNEVAFSHIFNAEAEKAKNLLADYDCENQVRQKLILSKYRKINRVPSLRPVKIVEINHVNESTCDVLISEEDSDLIRRLETYRVDFKVVKDINKKKIIIKKLHGKGTGKSIKFNKRNIKSNVDLITGDYYIISKISDYICIGNTARSSLTQKSPCRLKIKKVKNEENSYFIYNPKTNYYLTVKNYKLTLCKDKFTDVNYSKWKILKNNDNKYAFYNIGSGYFLSNDLENVHYEKRHYFTIIKEPRIDIDNKNSEMVINVKNEKEAMDFLKKGSKYGDSDSNLIKPGYYLIELNGKVLGTDMVIRDKNDAYKLEKHNFWKFQTDDTITLVKIWAGQYELMNFSGNLLPGNPKLEEHLNGTWQVLRKNNKIAFRSLATTVNSAGYWLYDLKTCKKPASEEEIPEFFKFTLIPIS